VFLDRKVIAAKKDYEVNIKQFRYWSGVASQFPNIPDILYNASVSSLNVGKTSEAKLYIDKALQIDPLFKQARELKKLLEKG
jgi:Tfp pilus assembly protein PilF